MVETAIKPQEYTPDPDVSAALKGSLSTMPEGLRDPYEKAFEAQRKNQFDMLERERVQKADLAQAKATAAGGLATSMQQQYDQFKKMEAPPKFNVAPETREGLIGMASLLPIAGLILGAGGMSSGVNAMQALTGIINGHAEGNKARIDFEKTKYEAAMKDWDANYKLSRQKLTDALEMMKTNYQAGLAKAEAAAVAMGPETAAILRKEGLTSLIGKIDEAAKRTQLHQDKIAELTATRAASALSRPARPITVQGEDGQPYLMDPTTRQPLTDETGAVLRPPARAGSQLAQSFQQQVDIAVNEAAYQTSLLKDLPVATSGVFGMRGKPTTLFQAPLEALANQLTPEATQRYNDIMMTMGREAAKVMGGGRSMSDTAANQWARQFVIGSGDKGFTALQRLAMLRGTFERGIEVLKKGKNVSPEMLEMYNRAEREFAEAIPITARDVQRAQDEQMRAKGKSQKKFSDLMASALPSGSAAPAQQTAPAPAAGKEKARPGEVVHQDAQGNKAVQRNGTWVEVED
jgi:hypothetical protein